MLNHIALPPVMLPDRVVITYKDDPMDLKQASEELHEATLEVADCAQTVESHSTKLNSGYFMVAAEDFQDMQDALKRWQEASRVMLKVL